jgi:hypothetical protein
VFPDGLPLTTEGKRFEESASSSAARAPRRDAVPKSASAMFFETRSAARRDG